MKRRDPGGPVQANLFGMLTHVLTFSLCRLLAGRPVNTGTPEKAKTQHGFTPCAPEPIPVGQAKDHIGPFFVCRKCTTYTQEDALQILYSPK